MTPKQQLFVQEYLIDLNASAAARRAGYSYRNSDKIGSELLGKTGVSEAIKEQMARRSERIEITADRVLQELALIAFGSVSDIFNGSSISEKQGRFIKSYSKSKGDVSVSTFDKIAALKLLGEHLNIFSKASAEESHLEGRKQTIERVRELFQKWQQKS